jgi:hypothetical protein
MSNLSRFYNIVEPSLPPTSPGWNNVEMKKANTTGANKVYYHIP